MDIRMSWVAGEGQKPNCRPDKTYYSYYRAIKDVFQLFLTFLYKHEDDTMLYANKTFTYFNRTDNKLNNPVVNVIHLYVTALADLDQPHSMG